MAFVEEINGPLEAWERKGGGEGKLEEGSPPPQYAELGGGALPPCYPPPLITAYPPLSSLSLEPHWPPKYPPNPLYWSSIAPHWSPITSPNPPTGTP